MMKTQKGMSLIETMISLAILSFGVLGATKMQVNMSVADQLAKQRSEATAVARAKLENFRNVAPTANGTSTYTGANASYVLTWEVVSANTTVGTPETVRLVVAWNDLRNTQVTAKKEDGTDTGKSNKVEFSTAL